MITADQLLTGPRGRRFLIEFAQASEHLVAGESGDVPMSFAVFDAAFKIATKRGHSVWRISTGHDPGPRFDVADVVAALPSVPLVEPTEGLLLDALQRSVDSAMYWQEPDGDDFLCAIPAVRDGLARVADHVVASPLFQRWALPMDPADQRSLVWDKERNRRGSVDLRRWRKEVLASERSARKEWEDIEANLSGSWWSRPPHELRTSTGTAPDGLPYGMHLVEDGLGWTEADAVRLRIDPTARVFEIASADDWARLCRDHPLEVTASRRHDWYRTTGRDGDWVVPDWCAVSEAYDGVHLTIAGYLNAATTAIPVDERFASVMAGCDPDTTWWLNDAVVAPDGEPETLTAEED